MFIPSNKDTGIKNIFGENVQKKEFSSYSKYKSWNDDKSIKKFEDKVKPEIQYLAEKYSNIPDEELQEPELKIHSIDIEVINEREDIGFPKPENPNQPIVSISISTLFKGKTRNTCFGLPEYNGKWKYRYIKCGDEKELLNKFFHWMHKSDYDILTGWFVIRFDLNYLYTRVMKLFGKESLLFNKLSPIGKANIWKRRDDDGFNIDIAGVTILDYKNIYKKFSRKNQESYKLDYIAEDELGEKKLEYEGTIREFYINEPERFIDYNIQDTSLVIRLEQKLGYIGLVQKTSLLTKCPMKFYEQVTAILEGGFLCYYRRNGLCAPKLQGGQKKDFEAAFVKEPDRGLHQWIIDLDVTSQYPFVMITQNMSYETYFGYIKDLTEEQVLEYNRKREYPEVHLEKDGETKKLSGKALKNFNTLLKKGYFSISPNGAIFNQKKKGIVPLFEEKFFNLRNSIKQKMISLDKSGGSREEINRLNSSQLAVKIIINALYGAISTPYFRLFNFKMAEAIPASGRHIIKESNRFVNEYMWSTCPEGREIENKSGNDYVLYTDTDSIFIDIYKWFKDTGYSSIFDRMKKEEKIQKILELSKKIEEYVNYRSFKEIQKIDFLSTEEKYKINFKQEVIAQSILFIEKKKYGFWMVNKEGAKKDELSITGLDIIRSETSKPVKQEMRKALELILKGKKDKEISDFIFGAKKRLKELSPEDLSVNIGVNNIEKYISNNGPKKGTPYHVKGVYSYRKLLEKFDVKNKYEDINEGDKAKVIYIKSNPWGFDAITYPGKFPKEFDVQPDKEKMIEKFFVNKIEMLLDPCNKIELLNQNKDLLESFF
ncbi:MAG: DNA polymerase domain-containing protein [Candidatus Woesearchaeota archaeon]